MCACASHTQIATLSILVDLPIVVEATEKSSFGTFGGAAQAGTRAGRIVRIMRVVRLLRLVRLVKAWQFRRLKKTKVATLNRLAERRRSALVRSVTRTQSMLEAKKLLAETEQRHKAELRQGRRASHFARARLVQSIKHIGAKLHETESSDKYDAALVVVTV